MKRIALLSLVAFFGLSCFAQEVAKKTPSDVIKFDTENHSFGKIPQGKPVTFDFMFTNVSKEPIVIEKAQASCGCTTPKWPTEPIMPGKTAAINVGYNAASVAPFDKTISVKIAGVDNMAQLRINGEVLAPEAKQPEAAPAPAEAKKEEPKKEEAKKAEPARTTKKAATTVKKTKSKTKTTTEVKKS